MKYYVFFNKMGMFLGFTTEKSVLEEFIRQRGKKNYTIEALKKKDMNEELIKKIDDSMNEIVFNEGKTLFPSEEEYFIEGLNQFFNDVRCNIERLDELLDYLSLDKDEEKAIKKALYTVRMLMDEADGMFYDDEANVYNRYLKMGEMIDHIIDRLN